MKAVLQDGYGPPETVLRVGDVERPAPGPGEVLVRVRAASVHPDIWHVVTGRANGRFFGSLPRFAGLALRSPFDRHLPPLEFRLPPKQASLSTLRDLLADGRLAPIVDQTYPLEEVCEAMRRLQAGKALGRLLLTP